MVINTVLYANPSSGRFPVLVSLWSMLTTFTVGLQVNHKLTCLFRDFVASATFSDVPLAVSEKRRIRSAPPVPASGVQLATLATGVVFSSDSGFLFGQQAPVIITTRDNKTIRKAVRFDFISIFLTFPSY